MSEYWLLIVILVILVAIVAACFAFYMLRKKKKQTPSSIQDGKSKVVGKVKRWATGSGFRVITPARLGRKGAFANLDAIVIGYFGILGVKAYGYNGEIYGSANEEEWLRVAPDGSRSYFANPITTASADTRVIRSALFEKKLKMTPVEVVCVFCNKEASIAAPKNTGHYTMATFKAYLDKERFREDKGVDLDKLEEAIRDAIVPE